MKKYLLIILLGISVFLLNGNNVFAATQKITKTSDDLISAKDKTINVNFSSTDNALYLNLNKPVSFNAASKLLSVHILTKNDYNGNGVIIKLHLYAIIYTYITPTTMTLKEEDYVKDIVTNNPLQFLSITSQDAPTFIENFSNRINYKPPVYSNSFYVTFGKYNDTLRCHVKTSDAPSVVVSGGAGDDIIEVGGKGGGYQDGQEGNDVIIGGDASDGIEGGPGADVLIGGKGNDSIYALKSGPNSDVPDDQGDILIGGAGDDNLCGNPNKQTISPYASLQAGNYDILLGGKGKDTFVGFGGLDMIFIGFQDDGDIVYDSDNNDIIAY